MAYNDISNVLNVWESQNKILKPKRQELLLNIVEQIASLFSLGPYYYYVFNFETLKIELASAGVKSILGINPEDFVVEQIFDRLHPEDQQTMPLKEELVFDFFLNKITIEDIFHYKTVYMMRIQHTDGTYKTILHQVKVLSASEDGKIQQVLGIHTDVTNLGVPFHQKVSFISSEKPCYYALEPKASTTLSLQKTKSLFTGREREIIKMISEGNKFIDIAGKLYISPHTVRTHKKNILAKSGCRNTPELITKCIMEGVI
ncbi:LuxR C-terminal-related transcriptional regulator [Formosa haliotis]|uniref:LuxR C-terminal-related transcriptional regulator n=1 Tax=Formosa haliotis TaxID=1555194 RepID=UPI00082501B1|nr:LuxR C-terminal-related transcriptional regulator [Formosa haliotis]